MISILGSRCFCKNSRVLGCRFSNSLKSSHRFTGPNTPGGNATHKLSSRIETPPATLESMVAVDVPSLLFYFTKFPQKLDKVPYSMIEMLRVVAHNSSISVADGEMDKKTFQLNDAQLGMILYSVKQLAASSSGSKEREDMLELLLDVINRFELGRSSSWSAKTIRMGIYGLQNIRFHNTNSIISHNDKFRYQGVGGDDDDSNKGLQLLKVYTEKILMHTSPTMDDMTTNNNNKGKKKQDVLFSSSREVASTLYGLRNLTVNMNDCSAESDNNRTNKTIRNLLSALCSRMPTSYAINNIPPAAALNNRNQQSNQAGMVTSPVSSRDISNSLFGLQKMSCNVPEVKELILKLLPMINAYTAGKDMNMMTSTTADINPNTASGTNDITLHDGNSSSVAGWKAPSSQEVDNSLFGLKSFSSYTYEVRLLIKSLIPYVASCNGASDSSSSPLFVLGPNHMSASLHGFQHLSSKHSVVRELLRTMNTLLIKQQQYQQQCGDTNNKVMMMSGLGVGNALYGLRNMNSSSHEVRELMQHILTFIDGSSGRGGGIVNHTDGSGTGMVGGKKYDDISTKLLLNALRGMKPVTKTYAGYNNKSTATTVTTNFFHRAHNISNALYGLHNMSSLYPETRKLVGILAKLIELNSLDLGNNKYSSNHNASGNSSNDDDDVFSNSKYQVLPMSPQEVSNAIYGLHNMSSEHFEVKSIIRSLTPYISKCTGVLTGTGVANMLYGMRMLSIHDVEVKVLWNIITHLMLQSKQEVEKHKHEGIYRYFYLFNKNNSADGRESNDNTVMMKPKEVCMAMLGMSGTSSDHSEIREVIEYLVPLIPVPPSQSPSSSSSSSPSISSSFLLSPTNMCCTVYGLKDMNTKHSEVVELLEKLLPLLTYSSYENMKKKEAVVNSFTGSEERQEDEREVKWSNGTSNGDVVPPQYFNKNNIYMCMMGIKYLNPDLQVVKDLYSLITHEFLPLYTEDMFAWSRKRDAALSVVIDLESKYHLYPPITDSDNVQNRHQTSRYPELQLLIDTFRYQVIMSKQDRLLLPGGSGDIVQQNMSKNEHNYHGSLHNNNHYTIDEEVTLMRLMDADMIDDDDMRLEDEDNLNNDNK